MSANATTTSRSQAVQQLRHSQTVSRELVHVRAVSEVFTTDSVQLGPDEFLVAVQLPRAHTLWCDRRFLYHDPLISMEISRQAVFQIVHERYEVPVDWHFILRTVEFRVAELEAYSDDLMYPPEGFCRGRLLDRQDGDGFVTMSFEGDLTLGDIPAMEMAGEITGMRPAEYALLRGQTRGRKPLKDVSSPPQRSDMDPQLVGRRDPRNVVLCDPRQSADGAEHRYTMVVDQTHPAFFDHPHDHVTGSLILELYRQAAVASAYRSGALASPVAAVRRCALTFSEFSELEAVTECSAVVTDTSKENGDVTVAVRLLQFGEDLGGAEVTLTAVADTGAAGGGAG